MKLRISKGHPCYSVLAYLGEQDEPAPYLAWSREDWNQAIVHEDDALVATKAEWEYLSDNLPESVFIDFNNAISDLLTKIRTDSLIPSEPNS